MLKFPTIEELYGLFTKANAAVCTDTRTILKGSLFFALKGQSFNANHFAATAIEQGCAYAVIDETPEISNERFVLVKDVLTTLQELARHHRRQFNIPFLAITGSNGKTTNKELIHAVLSKKYKTLATIGNLNNHIGVPLTLLRVNAEHEFAIIEMGANHQGEIDTLCNIAEPDFGLITNIGKAHLEGFGAIEGVKKGKSEMYRYLKSKGGRIFMNGDDEVLVELAGDNDKVTYGSRKLYDVIGKDCTTGESVSLKFTTRYGEKDWTRQRQINTRIVGGYNYINCLAAACVGNYFKVDDALIAEALESYTPNMNRSQLHSTGRNTLILDAYNANPNSMKVAIENFAKHPAQHKLLLLGDMFELGEYSEEEHRRIIDLLKQQGFEKVALVGHEFYKTEAGAYLKFADTGACADYLKQNPVSGHTVLIKGSRGMKMESLKELL